MRSGTGEEGGFGTLLTSRWSVSGHRLYSALPSAALGAHGERVKWSDGAPECFFCAFGKAHLPRIDDAPEARTEVNPNAKQKSDLSGSRSERLHRKTLHDPYIIQLSAAPSSSEPIIH